MKKKDADIEDLLATFSAYVSENYPESARFRENMGALLSAKKERMKDVEYVDSLERNVIFLQELIVEGEVLLEEILESVNEEESILDGDLGPRLQEMEKRARQQAAARHGEIFVEGRGGTPGDLAALRSTGGRGYVEKLEFNYSYLMTLRMLLFEFFNVIAEIRKGYLIDRIDSAATGLVMNNIEMTANYYLGNISVGEIVEDEKGEAGGG